MTIAIGDAAPDFRVDSTAGPLTASDLWRDGPMILTFFTEAGTPTCQLQIATFAEAAPLLAETGATVVAISADAPDRQTAFATATGATFPMASDPDLAIARAYGVADDETRRAQRAVFVIGTDGVVRYANPRFSPGNPSQLEAVMAAVGVAL
ncbi:MAG: peroxiredoxin family protein [Dehalococcoidia bacterium]|nr:peroxiredoxin family protein [Dehalococcoidia bacterium]